MSDRRLRIAVVGMNFGSAFAAIYAVHPDVEYVGVCDSDAAALSRMKARGFERLHADLGELLASRDYDAVHLCLPVTMHVEPTLAALRSGKHCARAVPMGDRNPHLAHEFVRSIIEERQPYIHARRAANWCAPGICAHESAMRAGERVSVPGF